jgi:hypothetical protein
MPGVVSESSSGPKDGAPYVPSWLYTNGPKTCPCGHHEGHHNDEGQCVERRSCRCPGLPSNCLTPREEMW